MSASASSDQGLDGIREWIDGETRPLDVVASWESLCDTYRVLEFSDPLNDAMRLEEFKWIIKEMNKHLTRMRTMLMGCKDVDDMLLALVNSMTSTGATLDSRRSLAYQKLRQRWVRNMIAMLSQMKDEQEGAQDGRGE